MNPSCGAVTAAIAGGDNGYNLNHLLAHIEPAKAATPGGTVDEVEHTNARLVAKDLVNHYIDNSLPNDFKAQVVCHSKLAATRYQKAIRQALRERVERERLKHEPDAELIRRIQFLNLDFHDRSRGSVELELVPPGLVLLPLGLVLLA